jgi:hypothetical protein
MGKLFETIRQLVAEEKYVVGQHASERLEERGIMEWQVVAGLDESDLMQFPIRPWKCASVCQTAGISRLFGLSCVKAESQSW